MRVFVVLCLVGAACAQYNYHQNNGSPSGGLFQPASSNAVPSYSSSGSSPSYAAPTGAESYSSPSYASPTGAESYSSPSYASPAELDKEYYSFTADEGDFYDPAASEQVANNLKKGLRVVFIKGPENNGLENAALALAKQAADQRTAIYVLNKQADIGDLANKLNSIRNNQNNKPEVHFVKYRTPEDAANAQKAIQSQYDQLGGHSQSINGGVAPAINFASRSPVAHRGSYSSASEPRNSYLPANILRRLRY